MIPKIHTCVLIFSATETGGDLGGELGFPDGVGMITGGELVATVDGDGGSIVGIFVAVVGNTGGGSKIVEEKTRSSK